MNPLTLLLHEDTLAGSMEGMPVWGLLLTTVITILVLSKGADWMIDGAANLAARTGLSKIFIGATILSLGTTAPETFVSVTAALMGNPSLALGNGVGSIIADTGLIFGLTVLVARPRMDKWMLKRSGQWQVGAALLLVVLSVLALFTSPIAPESPDFPDSPGTLPLLGRFSGIIMIIALVLYLLLSYKWARNAPENNTSMKAGSGNSHISCILALLVIGLILVIIASRILVPTAAAFARRFGVAEDVIAATLVAFGTSVPELATAIAAIRKGHPEITVGNIIGADVLNVLFVIGASATLVPLAIPSTFFAYHFPAMLLLIFSFRFFILIDRKGRFQLWQGLWLILIYLAYISLQYLKIG